MILATGGFSRSTDLLRTFAPEQLAAIPYGGAGNTGDGLKMAWKLGAGVADMSYITATYGSHPDTGEEFHELLTAYYMGAIIVNKDGRRFMDESQSYKTLGREVLKQPEGLGFEIFDAKIRAKSHPGIPLNDIGMIEDLGHIFKADSLEELAEAAGIDADALVTDRGPLQRLGCRRRRGRGGPHQPVQRRRRTAAAGPGTVLRLPGQGADDHHLLRDDHQPRRRGRGRRRRRDPRPLRHRRGHRRIPRRGLHDRHLAGQGRRLRPASLPSTPPRSCHSIRA